MALIRSRVFRRVTPVILCLVMVLNFSIRASKPAEAFVIAVPMVEGAAIVVGSFLTTLGVIYATNGDFRAATSYAWQNMTSDLQNMMNGFSTNLGTFATVSGQQWSALCDWFSSTFGNSTAAETTVIPSSAFITDSTSTSAFYSGNTPALIVPAAVGTYVQQMGSAMVTWELTNQNTKVIVQFANGTQMINTTASYKASSTSESPTQVELYYPSTLNGNQIFYGLRTLSASGAVLSTKNDYPTASSYSFILPGGKVLNSLNYTGSSPYSVYGYIDGVKTTLQTYPSYTTAYRWIHDFALGLTSLSIGSDVINGSVGGTLSIDRDYSPGGTAARDVAADGSISIPIPTTIDGAVAAKPADIAVSIDTPIAIPNTTTDDDNTNKFKAPSTILNKFPFCIPFDLFKSVNMLIAPAVTPEFTIPIKFPRYGIDTQIDIDLSNFDVMAGISRWFLSAIFLVSLIVATRKLVKG